MISTKNLIYLHRTHGILMTLWGKLMWLDGSVYEGQRISGNQHGWPTYGHPPTSSERRAHEVTSQIKVIRMS